LLPGVYADGSDAASQYPSGVRMVSQNAHCSVRRRECDVSRFPLPELLFSAGAIAAPLSMTMRWPSADRGHEARNADNEPTGKQQSLPDWPTPLDMESRANADITRHAGQLEIARLTRWRIHIPTPDPQPISRNSAETSRPPLGRETISRAGSPIQSPPLNYRPASATRPIMDLSVVAQNQATLLVAIAFGTASSGGGDSSSP
jgi:hypothetical protein